MDLNLKKYQNDLMFLPLGGANEIGMNVNLYHLDGKWLMVDLGVGFASDVPGVSMLTANIDFIKNHRKNLLGLIITHIHEDHLGAVQYLWEELQVPVYASKLAANFLISKLAEFKLDKKVPINIIDAKSELNLGSFIVKFIGLTHSVPEMQALIIKTRHGNILHTGDWKFDDNPVVGNISQKDIIKNYGDKGEILAVICDSTNAINEGHSKSEGDLYQSLKNLITGRKGMVGVTTFASNIARIYTIAKIAREVGRKVVLAGYSLQRICDVGKKSGYFDEDFEFISDKQIKFFSKDEILVICTGCQGEQLAATRKIAADVHPTIRFTKNDLMIFSSKIIPGNEKKIFELFDLLAKRQIDVMTEKDHFVHVSGHPSQDELFEMYQLARPKIAIPVHGEFLHTKTHCEIAKKAGVEKVFQIENGLVVRIGDNLCEKIGFVPSGYKAVDGKQLLDLDGDVIRERRKLQETGIVIVSINLDNSFAIIETRIKTVGSYSLKDDEYCEDIVKKEISIIINGKSKELAKMFSGSDKKSIFSIDFLKKKKDRQKINRHKISNELEKSIRSKILKIFEDFMGKRPAVEVFVHFSN